MTKFKVGDLVKCKYDDPLFDGKLGVIIEVFDESTEMAPFYDVQLGGLGKYIMFEDWLEKA